MQRVEVVVVGYGPVGQLVAHLLGAAGVRTLVLERSDALHPGPRAAALDDEGLRILQAAGLAEAARETMLANVPIEFVTRRGRVVRLVDCADTRNGQPFVSLMHQPALEAVLDAGVRSHECVEVRHGLEVLGLAQEPGRVAVTLADGGEVVADWLVACDGARSPVRAALGVQTVGSRFAQPWLVVDTLLEAPRREPPAMRFVGDPVRPRVSVPMGPRRHRWEFMVLPGEDAEALAGGDRVRELLSGVCAPARVEVERATIYTFGARVAESWRVGRVLLAGDAAHVMPPFAGQGLCSGLRDAQNLVWKFAAVLREGAPEALLDSYEAERRPHVEAMTRLARVMGAVVQTRRPRAAALRDGALAGLSQAPWLGPRARSGSVRPSAHYTAGAFGPGGGKLFGQPLVRGVALDDLLPSGRWALLGAGRDPREGLGVTARAAFGAAAGVAVDPGLLSGAELVVLRPDRFVFARDAADGARAATAHRQLMGERGA